MLNLNKSVRILEFDKILNMLSSFAQTEGAKKRALALVLAAVTVLAATACGGKEEAGKALDRYPLPLSRQRFAPNAARG